MFYYHRLSTGVASEDTARCEASISSIRARASALLAALGGC